MDYINKVELAGVVGTVRLIKAGGHKFARMSVATVNVYVDRAGERVQETTWHNVIAWQKPGIEDIAKISKGSKVHITGKIHFSRYTGADGMIKSVYEITADTLQECE